MPKIPDDILDQARHADLVEYLQTHGFELKREGKSYRVSGYSGGLIVTGNKWSWKSQGIGGKSVDFLVTVLEMPLQQAVEELTSGNIPYLQDELSPPPKLPITANFELSERANNEKRVIAYLCKRKIQYDTITKLIKSGKLYQDTRENCVFIITDWNGRAVGTETHGTGTNSRYKNSTRHTGYGFRLFCGNHTPTGAMFFESAIDLLSYYQIFKKQLTHHYLISTAGTGNYKTIQVFHQQRPELKICLCCDNDQAGEILIQKVRNKIDSQVFVHHPKYHEDWNEVLCQGDTPE